MRSLTNLLCLLITFSLTAANAQELKTISRDTLNFREKFQVLKSDNNVRHGTYMLVSKTSGRVTATGFYKDNQRDGVWREFDRQDHVVTEGRYTNGKKTGIWNYYNERWVVNDSYDYDKDRLIYHRPTRKDSTSTYNLIVGKDTMNVLPERPPIYLGGDAAMFRTLLANIKYPPEAVRNKISARVVVKFTLDENGTPRDYSIEHPTGYGLDDEALRVVKMIPPHWIPAVFRGRNVPAVVTLPVNFKAD